jgi:hypothetical protein
MTGYRAGADSNLAPRKALEDRVTELELRISAMQIEMKLTKSKVDRALQPGPMLINHR